MISDFFQNLLYILRAMLVYPPVLRELSLSFSQPLHDAMPKQTTRNLVDLGDEVADLFTSHLTSTQMLSMSSRMCKQYKKKLAYSPDCMLPSYLHTLPSGLETGTYLALDVGGSTFRVALVELRGRQYRDNALKIVRMSVSPIDESVRRLGGTSFFDWMAEKIEIMLSQGSEDREYNRDILQAGLAWSFPIDQTSSKGGKMLGMGKGFHCSESTIGQDLGELIAAACARRDINLRIDAIVNDSSAGLLSRAYCQPATSMSLILGTGTNAAVHLPVSCMGRQKFGTRDPAWFERAEKVITNTELSMFGKDILPETRWDEHLNRTHQIPDFQPLEYMTTGRYLGEIFRLVILEAVEKAGLFDGILPEPLSQPYSLDTAILAMIEADTSAGLTNSEIYLQKIWAMESPPSPEDLTFLRTTVESISTRAAAYLAVAIHALWKLQKETAINPTTPLGTPKTSIACTGSVIIKYPTFRTRCEDYIEQMILAMHPGFRRFPVEKVVLELTDEAAILGAAVAVALSD